MRKRFDKSPAIDAASNLRLVTKVQTHTSPYTGEEEELLVSGLADFDNFRGQKGKVLKMGSQLTTAEFVHKQGDRLAFGYAVTTVRARPAEVLAYLWDLKARGYRRRDHLERSVEPCNDHNQVLYLKVAFPGWSLQDRDFLSRFVWRAEGEGFELVSRPMASPVHPLLKDVVRATYPSAYKIIDAGNGYTMLKCVQSEASVLLPRWNPASARC
jgi:hypothetical protein